MELDGRILGRIWARQENSSRSSWLCMNSIAGTITKSWLARFPIGAFKSSCFIPRRPNQENSRVQESGIENISNRVARHFAVREM